MSQDSHDNGALLVLWGEVNNNDTDHAALNDWWTNEHLPERLSIPGFLRARRYYSSDNSDGATHYLTLYKVSSLDVLTSEPYMEKLNHPTPGTQQHLPTLGTMKRSACEILYHESRPELTSCRSCLGAGLAIIECHLVDDNEASQSADALWQTLSSLQQSDKHVMSFTFLQENQSATEPGSSSQSYQNVALNAGNTMEGVKCLVLLECSSPARLPFVNVQTLLRPVLDQLQMQSKYVTTRIYDLMCSQSS